MAADSEFTPVVRRLGCLRGISHADRVRAGGRDRRLGPVHRRQIGAFVGLGAQRALLRASPGCRGRSPRPATPTPAGCWSRRPGTTAPATASGKTMRDRWELAPAAARVRGDAGNRRLHHQWVKFIERRKKPHLANVAIARELAGWCWSLATLDDSNRPPSCFVGHTGRCSAWSDPRNNYEQPRAQRRDARLLDSGRSCRTAPSCGTQPAHISLTARRQRHARTRPTRRSTRRRPDDHPDGASPCPLTRSTTYQGCSRTGPGPCVGQPVAGVDQRAGAQAEAAAADAAVEPVAQQLDPADLLVEARPPRPAEPGPVGLGRRAALRAASPARRRPPRA